MFEEYGVAFVSVTENFDTSSPMGRAMVYIIMVFAQLERETIAERIKDNAMHRASLGRWTGGPVPFGYDKQRITENGKEKPVLIVNAAESKIVQMFYDWYLEPAGSIRGIVIKANTIGIKTKQGLAWNSNQMSRILQNALYAINTPEVYNFFTDTGININNSSDEFDNHHGMMYFRRRKEHKKTTRERPIEEQHIIIGEHKGIIEGEKWVQVQQKLSGNKSKPPRLGSSINSILSGIVRCGVCDSAMSVFRTNLIKPYYYFKCRKKEHQGKVLCSNSSIQVKELEHIVEQKVFEFCSDKEMIKQKLLKAKDKTSNIDLIITHKKDMQNNLKELSKEIDNLIANLGIKKDGVLVNYVEKRIEKLEQERINISRELKKIENELKFSDNDKVNIDFLLSAIDNYSDIFYNATREEKQTLIRGIIKSIYVDHGKVTINFFLTNNMPLFLSNMSDSNVFCSRTHMGSLRR